MRLCQNKIELLLTWGVALVSATEGEATPFIAV